MNAAAANQARRTLQAISDQAPRPRASIRLARSVSPTTIPFSWRHVLVTSVLLFGMAVCISVILHILVDWFRPASHDDDSDDAAQDSGPDCHDPQGGENNPPEPWHIYTRSHRTPHPLVPDLAD